jgi:hypothetical protein
MAWPPIIPPNTRQNITPELDSHPSDHNLISNALTAMLPTAWTVLPPSSGYQPQASYQTPQYRKEGDIVRCRGIMQKISGFIANGDVIAYLPAGFRPPAKCGIVVSYGALATYAEVNTDGAIVAVFPPGSSGNMGLFTITFSVTP